MPEHFPDLLHEAFNFFIIFFFFCISNNKLDVLTGLYDNNIQFYFRAFVLSLQLFDLLKFSAQEYAPMIFSSCRVRLILAFLQFLAINNFCLSRVSQVRICLPYFKLNVKCMTVFFIWRCVFNINFVVILMCNSNLMFLIFI